MLCCLKGELIRHHKKFMAAKEPDECDEHKWDSVITVAELIEMLRTGQQGRTNWPRTLKMTVHDRRRG